MFSCTCAVSLRLDGKLSERPDSTGFCLSRPGTQFSYILTYKATEMQGSAAALGTTVGEAGVRSAREGSPSVCRALKESPESVLGRKWGSDKRFRGVFG